MSFFWRNNISKAINFPRWGVLGVGTKIWTDNFICSYTQPLMKTTIWTLFSYVSGPYFKYRVYWDMFNSPFPEFAPCKQATLERMCIVPVWAGIFLVTSYFYPLKVCLLKTLLKLSNKTYVLHSCGLLAFLGKI